MKVSTRTKLLFGAIFGVLICLVVGVIIVFLLNNQDEDESTYCFATDEDPVRLYGIKGVYDFENSVLIKPNLSSGEPLLAKPSFNYMTNYNRVLNPSRSVVHFYHIVAGLDNCAASELTMMYAGCARIFLGSECESKQVWTIIRHGVRYPEGIQIPDYEIKLPKMQNEIVKNYEKKMYSKNKKLCDSDLENIKNWKLHPNVSLETAYDLSEFGRKQMFILADRFKKQYPKIFNSPYKKEDFQFLHTYTEQCVLKSFEAFFEGLFGKPFDKNFDQNNQKEEQHMDLKSLEKIRMKIKNNRASTEPIRFTEKPIFLKMLSNVSEKLGYNLPLNWETIKMLFDICRYDYGWNIEEISPWCALFSENEQKILEYYEDLSTYYEYGFGNELTGEIGCNQIKSLIYNFMKVANGDKHPKAIVHTSHRAYFETLQVALNITKDPYILTADNYEMVDDRKWRTTNDCPYATQFTAVFYSCNNEDKYVHFTMNEKSLDEIKYPGCKDGLCPWNSVFNRLKPISNTCNLD